MEKNLGNNEGNRGEGAERECWSRMEITGNKTQPTVPNVESNEMNNSESAVSDGARPVGDDGVKSNGGEHVGRESGKGNQVGCGALDGVKASKGKPDIAENVNGGGAERGGSENENNKGGERAASDDEKSSGRKPALEEDVKSNGAKHGGFEAGNDNGGRQGEPDGVKGNADGRGESDAANGKEEEPMSVRGAEGTDVEPDYVGRVNGNERESYGFGGVEGDGRRSESFGVGKSDKGRSHEFGGVESNGRGETDGSVCDGKNGPPKVALGEFLEINPGRDHGQNHHQVTTFAEEQTRDVTGMKHDCNRQENWQTQHTDSMYNFPNTKNSISLPSQERTLPGKQDITTFRNKPNHTNWTSSGQTTPQCFRPTPQELPTFRPEMTQFQRTDALQAQFGNPYDFVPAEMPKQYDSMLYMNSAPKSRDISTFRSGPNPRAGRNYGGHQSEMYQHGQYPCWTPQQNNYEDQRSFCPNPGYNGYGSVYNNGASGSHIYQGSNQCNYPTNGGHQANFSDPYGQNSSFPVEGSNWNNGNVYSYGGSVARIGEYSADYMPQNEQPNQYPKNGGHQASFQGSFYPKPPGRLEADEKKVNSQVGNGSRSFIGENPHLANYPSDCPVPKIGGSFGSQRPHKKNESSSLKNETPRGNRQPNGSPPQHKQNASNSKKASPKEQAREVTTENNSRRASKTSSVRSGVPNNRSSNSHFAKSSHRSQHGYNSRSPSDTNTACSGSRNSQSSSLPSARSSQSSQNDMDSRGSSETELVRSRSRNWQLSSPSNGETERQIRWLRHHNFNNYELGPVEVEDLVKKYRTVVSKTYQMCLHFSEFMKNESLAMRLVDLEMFEDLEKLVNNFYKNPI